MNKINITMGTILALAVGGIIGYAGAGYKYSAQLEKAKAAFPALPTMLGISGTIQSISGETVTLQASPAANPFDETPSVRQVIVTNATKIVKNVPKDPSVLQKEMDAFQKASQKAPAPTGVSGTSTAAMTTLPPPPVPFIETTLKLSDLKAGDFIYADAGKDVKSASSFDAVTITVNSSAASVPPVSGGNPGSAPMINVPQVRTDGGVPPTVNNPPPASKK